jgi:hypothetical protein
LDYLLSNNKTPATMAMTAITISFPLKLKSNIVMRPVRISQMESTKIPRSLIFMVPPREKDTADYSMGDFIGAGFRAL